MAVVIFISIEGKGRRRSRLEWHGLVVLVKMMMMKSSSRGGGGGRFKGRERSSRK